MAGMPAVIVVVVITCSLCLPAGNGWSSVRYSTPPRPAAQVAPRSSGLFDLVHPDTLVGAPTVPEKWIELNGTNPPVRLEQAEAYDPADGYLVLFGGVNGAPHSSPYLLQDTWTFGSGGWIELCGGFNASPKCPAEPHPGPASMVYDPAEGYMLLVDADGDSWTFLHGSWNALDISGQLPANFTTTFDGETGEPLAYDPYTAEVILVDGEIGTWGFAKGSWTLLAPGSPTGPLPNCTGPQGSNAFFFDPSYADLVYLCGTAGYRFSNATWEVLTVSLTPPDGFETGDFDPALDGFVAVSGKTLGGFTWLFDQGAWSNVSELAGPAPPIGPFQTMIYDPGSGYSILLDGQNFSGAGPPSYNFTWILVDNFQADVDSRPAALVVGQNLTFNLSLIGGVLPYNYSISGLPPGCPFPDLGATERCEPTVPGNYFLVLRGDDLGGNPYPLNTTSVNFTSVEVYPKLAVAASASPNSTIAGSDVTYNASVSGGDPPYEFGWSFGDGQDCAALNCSHAFSLPGVFASNFTARDALGEDILVQRQVLVDSPLVLRAVSNVSATDVGQPVTFTALPEDGIIPFNFSWTFGDGSSASTSSAAHVYEQPGEFVANVSVRDAIGEVRGQSVGVTVNPLLLLHVTESNATPSVGQNITFVGSTSGGTAPFHFAWTFGGGAPSEISTSAPTAPAFHTFAAAGTYGVRLSVSDAAGVSSSVSLLIEVGNVGQGAHLGSRPPPASQTNAGVNATIILSLAATVGLAVVALVVVARRR